MAAKLVVITGANRGIGLALVQEYLRRGERVIGVCRQSSAALNASGAEIIDDIDVSEPGALGVLKTTLHDRQLDILINNAGILGAESLGKIDYKAVLQQIEVNALGPLRVTEALLENLKSGAKVGMITSRMGSISDNTSGGYYGYRMSKAALNAASMSLAHDLKIKRISVAVLHPGFVKTDMVSGAGDITPEEAAQRLALRMDQVNLENSGTFWHSSGEILPW